MADPNRQYWNKQFKILQDTWPKPLNFEKCIEICLNLHAMVQTAEVSHSELWSFEDELWRKMSEPDFRRVLNNSIAWKLWHAGRIEEITMNILIAGEQQVMDTDNWLDKLNISFRNTGNGMSKEEIEALSKSIDVSALRGYRLAVGRKTRNIINAMKPKELKQKIEPSRLERLLDRDAIVEPARGLIDYWGGKRHTLACF